MIEAAFGDLLREYRIAAGLSQEALAERARVSPGAISTLERSARRGPQITTLSLIVEALGLGDADRARLEKAAAAGRQRKPRDVPAAKTREPPTNLPTIPTSFRGREADLATLDGLVATRRLITLLGPGGVGKTRLALEAARARRTSERFAQGIWFVDLAPLGAPGLVATAIARTLGIREKVGGAIEDTIAEALAKSSLLLVLDNCEHLIEACAHVAESLVRRCPGITILATAREALRIEGECVVRVAPLAVEAGIASGPALELLLDRLLDADYSRFARLSPADRARAAEICRRLDGIPLALELAAGRAREVSLGHLAAGLDERFTLLANGRRTASPRESTLRGMIDWSFLPLDSRERTTFARLGIFADAFAPEAAYAIVGESPEATRAALGSLIAKSLVTVVEDESGRLRYRLLETMRAYARERLSDDGEYDRVAARFARYYLSRALDADARYGRIANVAFLALVEPDLDNFRAALDWSLGAGHAPALGAELAGAMGWIYRQTSLFAEGTRWVETALAVADLPAQVTGRLSMAMSYFAFNVGAMARARDAAIAASEAFERTPSAADLAWALAQEANCTYLLGPDEAARAIAKRAVDVARTCGDTFRLAGALSAAAWSMPIDRAPERFALLEEAITCYRASGDEGAIIPLSALAETHHAVGNYAAAFESGLAAVAQARKNRDRSNLAASLANLAAYALTIDEVEAADTAAREAIELVRDLGRTLHAMTSLQHRASIAARRGRGERGAFLLGASNALYTSFGLEREPTERLLYARTIDDLRGKLGTERANERMAEGANAMLDRAMEEALAPD